MEDIDFRNKKRLLVQLKKEEQANRLPDWKVSLMASLEMEIKEYERSLEKIKKEPNI